jgi:hypothetical protein
MAEDLSEYLRTRVPPQTKADFAEICSELGKTPTEQLRELVEEFIKREYGRLNDRIAVHIFRPADYEDGAWRVTIKLRNPAEMIWGGRSLPFVLPALPNRRLQSDFEYRAIVFDPNTHKPYFGGEFSAGEWRGHLYSNGCPEGENPTSIEAVAAELTSTVLEVIDRFASIRPDARTS